MHSTSETESARLMAQWLATGGAGAETAAEARTGDDGLSTGPFSYPAYCGNSADDGLRPSMTWPFPMGQCADDGLTARHGAVPEQAAKAEHAH